MRSRPPTHEQRRAQWLKGVLDLCVLGALEDGEAYGYQLASMLEEAGMGPIRGGTLYPVLSRLETDQLVTTSWKASSRGPDRKYYRLMPRGRELLGEARKEWTRFAESVTRVMVEGVEGGSQ